MKNKLRNKLSLQKQVIIKLNNFEKIERFDVTVGTCGGGGATETSYCS
jgi:hypothetical protein